MRLLAALILFIFIASPAMAEKQNINPIESSYLSVCMLGVWPMADTKNSLQECACQYNKISTSITLSDFIDLMETEFRGTSFTLDKSLKFSDSVSTAVNQCFDRTLHDDHGGMQ